MHCPWEVVNNWRLTTARLAQSVERETLNLKVVGSTPTSGSIPDVPGSPGQHLPFPFLRGRVSLFFVVLFSANFHPVKGCFRFLASLCLDISFLSVIRNRE
ncbi:hypothetical protein QBC45DRAFT_400888 [Copromyces sp. CBS 386.78]|nr:hypothetical protein QBC45DRAFT_400888 [Copromyces sp. CBS 386.78]